MEKSAVKPVIYLFDARKKLTSKQTLPVICRNNTKKKSTKLLKTETMFFIISQDYTLIVTKPYENKEMFLTTLNEQHHRPYRTMETKERSAHSVGLLCDVISRDRCQIEKFKTLVYCEKRTSRRITLQEFQRPVSYA